MQTAGGEALELDVRPADWEMYRRLLATRARAQSDMFRRRREWALF
jgi:hypothetical protein